jgi:uncharacterized protein YbjQ (UPF0145 family)
MLVVTTNDIPGYEIRAVYGEVFGLTVRSLQFGAGLSAGFRSIGGGEVPEVTRLVAQSRNEAMGRMLQEAQQRGANAVVGMRFDTGEIMQRWAEVCAYGTAVWVSPVTEDARTQYDFLVQAGQMPHQQAYRTFVAQ